MSSVHWESRTQAHDSVSQPSVQLQPPSASSASFNFLYISLELQEIQFVSGKGEKKIGYSLNIRLLDVLKSLGHFRTFFVVQGID